MQAFQNLVSDATKAVENGKEIDITVTSGIGSGLNFSFIPEDIESDDGVLNIYMANNNIVVVDKHDVTYDVTLLGYICGNIMITID